MSICVFRQHGVREFSAEHAANVGTGFFEVMSMRIDCCQVYSEYWTPESLSVGAT